MEIVIVVDRSTSQVTTPPAIMLPACGRSDRERSEPSSFSKYGSKELPERKFLLIDGVGLKTTNSKISIARMFANKIVDTPVFVVYWRLGRKSRHYPVQK